MWNPDMELAFYKAGQRHEKERARMKNLIREMQEILASNPSPAMQALAEKLAHEISLWNEQ
jgi:hypothetical protein